MTSGSGLEPVLHRFLVVSSNWSDSNTIIRIGDVEIQHQTVHSIYDVYVHGGRQFCGVYFKEDFDPEGDTLHIRSYLASRIRVPQDHPVCPIFEVRY